jgi:predicted nucleic acid-binding protein
MTHLLDTNVLLRAAQPRHPMAATALSAMAELHRRGHKLVVVPQVIYEFWSAATRPLTQNGLGLSASVAASEVNGALALFPLLDDTPEVFTKWKDLVVKHQVLGKQGHDARLVASMLTHGIKHLLTFNDHDFRRYADLVTVHPATLAGAKS